jgi:Transposase DDE domain
MAAQKKEYEVNKGLLNGHQVHTLSDKLLLEAVQARSVELLGDSPKLYVLHDPCAIRKPSAPKMEQIGKVLSLSKQVITGYKTFNSVVLDLHKQAVELLCHTTYSTGSSRYVSQETLADLQASTPAVQAMVAENKHINTSLIYHQHLQESASVLKQANPAVSICHISDREFDGEAHFEVVAAQGDEFITRLKLSRLSNELKPSYTPKGKPSKKKVYWKLVDKVFQNQAEYPIAKLDIKGKCYTNLVCKLEWEPLVLNEKTYQVVHITLLGAHKPLFEHPMLLITNCPISCAEEAKAVYKAYILRFKIEIVFKFLKQNLGWERFQIRDFESIKNLLAVGFFLVGYFKELENELSQHPWAEFLCRLACSKGKISIFFLLEGLTKLAHFQEVQRWKEQNNLSDQDIQDLMAQI